MIINEKFYPNNAVWEEPYISYLGSTTKNEFDYDLGIWESPKDNSKSWLLIQSNKTEDYQSGPILLGNQLMVSHLLNDRFETTLPIIETICLAQQQRFFHKTLIKDFPFRRKYLKEMDIISFLIEPFKTKNIVVYLKKNLTKLVVSVIVDKNQRWNNKFFYKGNFLNHNDILLIQL